jgi:hypothetical protein
MRWIRSLAAFRSVSAVAGAVLWASCGGNPSPNFVPNGGGEGVVVQNAPSSGNDAAAGAPADAGQDAPREVRSDGAAGTRADVGSAGAGGGGGGSTTDGGPGGGADGAVDTGPQQQDDPCTACEKRRCSNPVGYSSDALSDPGALLLGSISLCFQGTGWPVPKVDKNTCAKASPGPIIAAGPSQGESKSGACQDLLTCIHKTMCALNNSIECYCGVGVTYEECSQPLFKPTGLCAAEFEAAVESDVANNVLMNAGNTCLAAGAALEINNTCDLNCCGMECVGMSLGADADPSYCNADTTGAGGAAGSAGAAGTSGAAGSAGAAGTSGAAGSSGSGGTSGAAGAGGTPGGGGSGGHAGSSGAAGSGGAAGAGGAAGSAGSGAAGAPPPSLLQNSGFDLNTDHWSGVGTTLTRSSKDADGSAQSGSLDVSLTAADPYATVFGSAFQCLSGAAGVMYDVDAKVQIPSTNNTIAKAELVFFSSADCSGAQLGSFSTVWTAMTAWSEVMGSTLSPASTQSVGVELFIGKPSGQSSAEALFDQIILSHQ